MYQKQGEDPNLAGKPRKQKIALGKLEDMIQMCLSYFFWSTKKILQFILAPDFGQSWVSS